jgi:hypothetical protein
MVFSFNLVEKSRAEYIKFFFYLVWFLVFKLIKGCNGVGNEATKVHMVFLGKNKLRFGFWRSYNSNPDFSMDNTLSVRWTMHHPFYLKKNMAFVLLFLKKNTHLGCFLLGQVCGLVCKILVIFFLQNVKF